jgi:hypothetical protein
VYAIELFFSKEVEDYIRKKWRDLSLNNITSSIYEIEGIRPHVTLAVYDEIENIIEFKHDFEEYFNDIDSMEGVIFIDVGIFPTTGAVFMKPTITRELIDFHSNYHRAFEKYSRYANHYYIPGNWNPHCTFAIGLNNEEISRVVSCIIQDFKPIKGLITEIGLVHIIHDGSRFVSSKTILSKKLKY